MNPSLSACIERQLSEIYGKEIRIRQSLPVHGGDINITHILVTDDVSFFVKQNTFSQLRFFETESNGLKKLQGKSPLKVPEPLLFGQVNGINFLIMECLSMTAPSAQTWLLLGEGLALLHQNTQPQFGLDEDNYIGNLPQQNRLMNSWADFYAEQRILPLFRRAQRERKCTIDDVKEAERICKKFDHLFPPEPPALLHGDLWNGNFTACANGEVAVYDPAVYNGHREIDIAMTLLFGGFDANFYARYNEVYPLEKNWQNRIALCQLYPLLVHLILFGSAYYSRVKNVLKSYQ